MKQLLKIDKRVALYGSKKQIREAEIILIKNIPQLPTLSESQARLRIQDCLDFESVKVDILFDGNSVWSKKNHGDLLARKTMPWNNSIQKNELYNFYRNLINERINIEL